MKNKKCEGNCCEPLPEASATYVKCHYEPSKTLRLCHYCSDALINIGHGMPWNKSLSEVSKKINTPLHNLARDILENNREVTWEEAKKVLYPNNAMKKINKDVALAIDLMASLPESKIRLKHNPQHSLKQKRAIRKAFNEIQPDLNKMTREVLIYGQTILKED